MRTRSVALALLFALTPVCASTPSFAQDDPTVKAARARFNEGVEFFDKGQYENARAAFLQAYALRKHPAVLLNLAQSSLRSGHTLEAAKYFQQYLHDSTNLTAAQRGDAEKGLNEARTKLGRLEVSAPTSAEIFVDGDHVGSAPLNEPVDVEPGSHTVKANSDVKNVSVAAGQVLPVKFAPGGAGAVVAPVPVPTPGGTPAPPVDENATNPPPAETTPSPPASSNGPGFFSPPKTMAPVWIGAGVAVAGTALAVLFAVFKGQANTSYDQLQSEIESKAKQMGLSTKGLCNNPPMNFANACSGLSTDQNQVNTDATLANVGVGVAIAGAAFALGWYFFAPKRDTDSASSAPKAGTIAPIHGPGMNGLSISF